MHQCWGYPYYVSDLFEVRGGVETSYVFANGLRIAQVTPTGKQFLHADHLGSTVAVTTEAGTKLEGKSYVPYGLTRGGDDIDVAGYQFTDQERDTSTGLYNYDARLYDPVIGRFLSADSIVPYPLNPQSYNRYSYVLNNPLGFTDPTGHEPTNAKDANGIGVSDTGMLESISESYGSWDDKVGGENDATAAVVRWWATNPRWRVGSTQYVSKLSFVLNQLLDQGYDITGLTIDTIDGLFEDIRDYYTSINSGAAAGILLGGAQGLANRTIKKTPEGIVYKRTNPFDGEEYIGQSKSPSRFNARQGEHDNALGVQHEYEIIGRAEPGRPLDVLEESAIRQNGGIQKRGGHLANKRHQMSEERYRNAGGTVSLPY